jgi:hypothetical protein
MQVRDKFWLWGHEANAHHEKYGIPPSRITPLEAACCMGIPNLIMVTFRGKPEMPYDQYAIPLSTLDRVVWSAVGAGGRTSAAERDHVLGLAGKHPNIVGVFLDDFFCPDRGDGKIAHLSLQELRELRERLTVGSRRLRLQVTLYDYQLGMPLAPYLELLDDVSFWVWQAKDLNKLEADFAKLETILPPRCGKLLGLYMHDYGATPAAPMPVEAMQRQCETALAWLRQGRIDGAIFLASCICDVGLPAVEWTRRWIAQVGREELPARGCPPMASRSPQMPPTG